jgi:hypothetical protein
MKHEILKFKKGLFDYYKETVSGNKDITLDQAQKKMTRNMLLAAKADSTNFHAQKYMYGNLHFIVNERGVITWMKNKQYAPQGWKSDKKLYVQLSEELGIEDAETVTGLHMRNLTHGLKHKYNWLKRGMTVKKNDLKLNEKGES